MSDIAIKLSVLAEKKQKLLEEEARLLAKRKEEIGDFAQRFGLLGASNEFIAGLFLDAQNAMSGKADKVAAWEGQGSAFLKGKRNAAKAESTV